MTKNEMYQEIVIARDNLWEDRYWELTQMYLDQYGVPYWDHEEDQQEEIQLPKGAYKHTKSKRYVTQFGCYGYEPIETGLYEVMYQEGEAVAIVIFDKNLEIKQVKASGKGAKKRAAEIKEMGVKRFNKAI